MVERGDASIADVDAAMKLGAGAYGVWGEGFLLMGHEVNGGIDGVWPGLLYGVDVTLSTILGLGLYLQLALIVDRS
jgi:hypothetical protein